MVTTNLGLGAYLTAIGMGGVFLVLSILALLMWLVGFASNWKSDTLGESRLGSELSDEEIMAIAAAIMRYERSLPVLPVIKTSEAWKRAGRFEILFSGVKKG